MRRLSISLTLLITAAVALADKKAETKFSPGAAASYPAKQTNDGVTVAVVAYDTGELAHTAFGKLDPNQYGVLPVLVIIQNDTDQALKLEGLRVEYTGADNRRLEPTPASEVQVLGGAQRPAMPTGSPLPPLRKHKNPLNVWEIEGRSFAAKLLPPHEPVSGFFYFQTAHHPEASFYLTGIKFASNGRDVLFFEIPFRK